MFRICFQKPIFHKFFAIRAVFFNRFFVTFNRHSQRDVKDVFGVDNVSKEDVSGVYVGCVQRSPPENVSSLKETEFVTSYGRIRFDSQNQVKIHGQFDEDMDVEKFLEDAAVNDTNFVDEQYFGDSFIQTNSKISNRTCDPLVVESLVTENEAEKNSLSEVLKDANFIDKQYFLSETPIKSSIDTSVSVTEGECLDNGAKELEWLESKPNTNKSFEMAKFTFNVTNEWRDLLKTNLKQLDDNQNNDTSVYSGVQFAKSSPLKDVVEIVSNETEEAENNELGDESNEEESLDEVTQEDENINQLQRKESPKTAYEYYQQLKRGTIEPESENLREKFKVIGTNIDSNKDNPDGVSLDSQGFRNFKEQIVDYSKFRNEEIVWHLKKNILFNDCDILAIDKPYGIACHGNKSTADAPLLHDLLPHLAPLVNVEELYPVHRLDKDATGVLLLAKTKKTAALLLSMFKERQIKKYYTAITRGVPDNKEGIIDIPMEESIIDNRQRMVLRPDVEKDFQRVIRPSTQAKRAVTQYRVKKSQGNASLLEIFTETGVKHQIRCHLGFGLRTPILGDHKYSHLKKIAPQKLPGDMLVKLNVRQSKVRNIPLHLHCRLVTIPEIGRNGSMISIAAHLPQFFKKNAKALQLK